MEGKSHFHNQLDALAVKVLRMALHAEAAVGAAFKSLTDNNAEQARQVIDKDREINILECQIDDDSLKLLALEQPVALDLRIIVGAMRIIVDIERIGDEAVNIAERTLLLSRLSPVPPRPLMAELAGQATSMFDKAITSFKDQNSALAREVCSMDERANALHVELIKEAMRRLQSGAGESASAERAMHDILVARSLERIGDQSTNIAEAVIFIVDGVSIKHHCQPF